MTGGAAGEVSQDVRGAANIGPCQTGQGEGRSMPGEECL